MKKCIDIGAIRMCGGASYLLTERDFRQAGLVIGLSRLDFRHDESVPFLHYPMQDMGGVPSNWNEFIQEVAELLLAQELPGLVYCDGGKGRTGTFLASLIAHLEPEIPDPVEVVRKRYKTSAVETLKQAEAVFGIKGEPVPKSYLPWRPALSYFAEFILNE